MFSKNIKAALLVLPFIITTKNIHAQELWQVAIPALFDYAHKELKKYPNPEEPIYLVDIWNPSRQEHNIRGSLHIADLICQGNSEALLNLTQEELAPAKGLAIFLLRAGNKKTELTNVDDLEDDSKDIEDDGKIKKIRYMSHIGIEFENALGFVALYAIMAETPQQQQMTLNMWQALLKKGLNPYAHVTWHFLLADEQKEQEDINHDYEGTLKNFLELFLADNAFKEQLLNVLDDRGHQQD